MTDSTPTGTAVARYFFSPLYHPRGRWAVVRWWESRRLFYNVVVGTAGLVTLGATWFFSLLPPHAAGFQPVWIAIPIYGVMANVFYSFGAPVDLLMRRMLRQQGGPVAQALFRYGVAFAVGLTLLPIPLMAMSWLVRLLFR